MARISKKPNNILNRFGYTSTEQAKRAISGLQSRYPDLVSTVFTHGNDEVDFDINDEMTLDDVANKILGFDKWREAPAQEETASEETNQKPQTKKTPKNVIPKQEAEAIDAGFLQIFKDVTPNGKDEASRAWDVALEMTPGDKADKEAFKKEAENDPVIQQAFLELMKSPNVKHRTGPGLLDEVREGKSREAWQKYHDVFNRRFYQWLYDDRNCIKKRKRLPEDKKPKPRYSRSSDDAPVLVF